VNGIKRELLVLEVHHPKLAIGSNRLGFELFRLGMAGPQFLDLGAHLESIRRIDITTIPPGQQHGELRQ